jgi:Iron-containing redox enzyme
MGLRDAVEAAYRKQIEVFVAAPEVLALLEGRASRADYDAFLEAIARTHFASGQYLGFLYAVAPPGSLERVKHNLLEELGLDAHEGEAHGQLLEVLLRGAGLGERIPELRSRAAESIRERAEEPILYGTLREIGFAALVEISAFEWLLAHTATRFANALERHRGIERSALVWFTHHSEVDLRHAEEAVDTICDYADHHRLQGDHAETLVDATLRENVFLRRYFSVQAAARAGGMIS